MTVEIIFKDDGWGQFKPNYYVFDTKKNTLYLYFDFYRIVLEASPVKPDKFSSKLSIDELQMNPLPVQFIDVLKANSMTMHIPPIPQRS